MPKAKVSLSIGYPGATHEDILDIDEDEWCECETDEQRNSLLDEYWSDWANNYIAGVLEIVE